MSRGCKGENSHTWAPKPAQVPEDGPGSQPKMEIILKIRSLCCDLHSPRKAWKEETGELNTQVLSCSLLVSYWGFPLVELISQPQMRRFINIVHPDHKQQDVEEWSQDLEKHIENEWQVYTTYISLILGDQAWVEAGRGNGSLARMREGARCAETWFRPQEQPNQSLQVRGSPTCSQMCRKLFSPT